MKDTLRKQIAKYLESKDSSKSNKVKEKIAEVVNERSQKVGAALAREEVQQVLAEFENSYDIERLKLCYTLNSLYIDHHQFMGWWDLKTQVQAERIPLQDSDDITRKVVKAYLCYEAKSLQLNILLWRDRGFCEAVPLPLVPFRGYGKLVDFPIQESDIYREHGYSRPCHLPWEWTEFGLIVQRDLPQAGFWKAWKWWPKCKHYHIENNPELFADSDMWGTPVRYEPEGAGSEYAAVLGGREAVKPAIACQSKTPGAFGETETLVTFWDDMLF